MKLNKERGIKDVTTVNAATTGGAASDIKNNLLLIYGEDKTLLPTKEIMNNIMDKIMLRTAKLRNSNPV